MVPLPRESSKMYVQEKSVTFFELNGVCGSVLPALSVLLRSIVYFPSANESSLGPCRLASRCCR